MGQSGRSKKAKSGRSENRELGGLKEGNWTVVRKDSERSKRLKVGDPKRSKWSVQNTESGRFKKLKVDGHE